MEPKSAPNSEQVASGTKNRTNSGSCAQQENTAAAPSQRKSRSSRSPSRRRWHHHRSSHRRRSRSRSRSPKRRRRRYRSRSSSYSRRRSRRRRSRFRSRSPPRRRQPPRFRSPAPRSKPAEPKQKGTENAPGFVHPERRGQVRAEPLDPDSEEAKKLEELKRARNEREWHMKMKRELKEVRDRREEEELEAKRNPQKKKPEPEPKKHAYPKKLLKWLKETKMPEEEEEPTGPSWPPLPVKSGPRTGSHMIEVVLNDRLGHKVRVKCNSDDTVGDLKKLAAAHLGTRPEKLRIQKWYNIYKDHVRLDDYEIHDGMGLELYYY